MRRKKGIRAALTSAFFLGFAPVFGKQAILAGFSPVGVTAFRTVLAVMFLLVTMLFFQRRYFYIYPIGLAGCLLAGFINGIGSIFYYSALGRLDASVGHLLYSFYPIFIALWLVIERQPVTRVTILRLALSIPAILLIVQASRGFVDLLGALFMIASAILYALHLMINQRVLYEVPAPTVTLYTLLSMSATVAIAYLLFDRQMPPASASWWPIILLALMTFFSRILLFLGVKHLGGIQTALLGLSELLVAVVGSTLLLGERLSTPQWIGAGILAFSLFLVGFDRFSPERRRSSGWFAWLNPPRPPVITMDIRLSGWLDRQAQHEACPTAVGGRLEG